MGCKLGLLGIWHCWQGLTYVRARRRESHDELEDICRDAGGVYRIGEGNGNLKIGGIWRWTLGSLGCASLGDVGSTEGRVDLPLLGGAAINTVHCL